MFYGRRQQITGGFILIYTMIVGMMITLVCIFCFSMEMSRRKNVVSFNKYVNNERIQIKSYEYLTSQMSEFIHENVPNNDKVSADKFLESVTDGHNISYKESSIYYDSIKKNFVICSKIDDHCLKKDMYTYDFKNNEIKFMHLNTIYENH